MSIQVEICGNKGAFIKPYPDHTIDLIFQLSGRKIWKNTSTIFEASPSNMRMLEQCQDIDFIDDGALNEQKSLENLPSQNDKIKPLKTNYKPKLPWNKLQKDTLKQSWNRKIFAHFHGMGGRKTGTMIAEFGMLFMKKKITGVLVTGPLDVCYQWIHEQIPEHLSNQFQHKADFWDKKPLNKFWGNKNRLEILSINIDSIKTPKGKSAANDFIKRHGGNVMMIVDESHEIKNFSSSRSKAIREIGAKCSYRRIATGTPYGNSLLDVWSQFFFLDWRIIGHKYKTSFEAEFSVMRHQIDPVTKKKTHRKFCVANKNEKRFWDLIAPHCFRASDKEIRGDRKEANIIYHDYKMDTKTQKIYDELTESCLAEIDNQIVTTAKNGFSLTMRHQQLICGFLPNDQTGEIQNVSDQRLKVLEKVVKNIDGTFLIWSIFIDDYKRIQSRLKDLGYDVGIFRGTAKHKAKVKADFKSGLIDGMIVNPRSGGAGQNFQGLCCNDILYSYNFNQFNHWQSLMRIDREGAQGDTNHHIIRCENSVNVSTLNNLRSKSRKSRVVFDDIRQMIAGTYRSSDNLIKPDKTLKTKKKAKKVSKKELELLQI